MGSGVYTASTVTFRSHDNCVVPGTMVSGPPTRAGYRRRYEGEIVTLVTAGGHQLTVTPKHPILTDRGWVEAGLLDVGDDLACALSGEWSAIGGPDEDHVPSPIEDVVSALGMVESAILRTVPTTPEDFHGDGGTAEVDIVEIGHDLLGDVLQPGLVHEAAHGLLSGAPAPRSLAGESLPGGGELPSGLGSDDLTPAGLVGGGGVRPALGRGHLRHADPAGLRPGPQTDPSLGEPSLDDRPGDPVVPAEGGGGLPRFVPTGQVSEVRRVDHVGGSVGVGRRFDPPSLEGHPQKFAIMAQLGADLLERLSGSVQVDRLIEKTVREYHGDVLNVETREGWYSADGIIVANCKCSAAPDWGESGLSILGDDWEGMADKATNVLGSTRPEYVDLPGTRADTLQRVMDLAQDAEWEWGDRAATDALLDTVRWAERSHRSNIGGYNKFARDFEISGERVSKLLTGKNARTVIHGNEDSFLSILADGRIRNGYEVGSTHVGGGSDLYFSTRKYAEAAYFGIPLDVEDALRPVYGYRVSDATGPLLGSTSGRGATDFYSFSGWTGGTDIQWVLKPSWDGKTTLTLGDSLNTSGAPAAWVGDLRDGKKTAEWLRNGQSLNALVDTPGKGLAGDGLMFTDYIEAQIYGGVPLDAIETVKVDFSFLDSEYERIRGLDRGPESLRHINAAIDEMDRAISAARAKGLKVEVYNRAKRARKRTP